MGSQISVGARGELRIEPVSSSKLAITETGEIIERLSAGERLGTVLERKRTAINMSVEELVEKLPIRMHAYQRIESGFNRRPPDDILAAIARVLKLKVKDLKEVADLDKSAPVDEYF